MNVLKNGEMDMSKLDWKKIDPHQINHCFMDWFMAQDGAISWRGKQSGKEDWVDYDTYAKVYFRQWAIENDLPRPIWDEVFKEFLED
jgi:hypothetical protein